MKYLLHSTDHDERKKSVIQDHGMRNCSYVKCSEEQINGSRLMNLGVWGLMGNGK